MVDYLGYRAKMGVTTPSTNTVVQPEYDDMRPPGVTNHLGRMHIENIPTTDDNSFDKSLELIDAGLDDGNFFLDTVQLQRLADTVDRRRDTNIVAGAVFHAFPQILDGCQGPTPDGEC